MRLELSGELRKQIEAAAFAAYPNECVGLLTGRREGEQVRVMSVAVAENIAEEKHHRYVLEPRTFLRVQCEAEARGEEIVGVYHSHPDHPARPSVVDKEQAWGGIVYVIVQTSSAGTHEMTAWELTDGAMREVIVE